LSWAAWLALEVTAFEAMACAPAGALDPSSASAATSEHRGSQEAGIVSSMRTVADAGGGRSDGDRPAAEIYRARQAPPAARL
jgi:hypothetical protein